MEEKRPLEKKIKELEDILDNFQMRSPEMEKMKLRIMNIHSDIESALNMILLGNMCDLPNKEMTDKNVRDQFKRFFAYADSMDFAKKLNAAFKLGLIDEKMRKNIFKVNDMRITVAHEAALGKKLTMYEDRQSYLEALEFLHRTHSSLKPLSEIANEKIKAWVDFPE